MEKWMQVFSMNLHNYGKEADTNKTNSGYDAYVH